MIQPPSLILGHSENDQNTLSRQSDENYKVYHKHKTKWKPPSKTGGKKGDKQKNEIWQL